MTGQTVILGGAASRAVAKRIIDAAPLGAVCSVRPAKRTADQNAALWAKLSDISRAKPEGRMHTPEVWKSLFMSACGHKCQFELGLDGTPFPVGFRSSRLNKQEMSDLLEFVNEYGARHGVVWTNEYAED